MFRPGPITEVAPNGLSGDDADFSFLCTIEKSHGGKPVPLRPRPIPACLTMVMLLATTGCGGREDAPATAAIGGAGSSQDQPQQETSAEQPQKDPLHPIVVIETSLGAITVRLDAEKAPLTVDNFLAYVDRGHYERTIFHRVCKDYPKLIIGGAFTPELTEKAAYTPVRNEAHNARHNSRGTIAMARDPNVIDSATCYFFFNVTDNQELLDHKDRTLAGYGYCVFGEVIEGLDVIDRIAAVEVHDVPQFEQIPVETALIHSIRRVE